jgi:transposase
VCGVCGRSSRRSYDRKLRWVRDLSAGDIRIYLEIESRRVRCRSCAKVKQEKLAWLSKNWKAALRWQRLKPYQKFAAMIDRHWDGIAAYCRPENKVSLGFVEGLNNKIRVLQRRAYGLRHEEYLRLKILTAMLPEI